MSDNEESLILRMINTVYSIETGLMTLAKIGLGYACDLSGQSNGLPKIARLRLLLA
jgi:hypothetical protein